LRLGVQAAPAISASAGGRTLEKNSGLRQSRIDQSRGIEGGAGVAMTRAGAGHVANRPFSMEEQS
jgi:hypothetical protein